MEFWSAIAEIASKVGLLLGGAFGLYLAWKRVTAVNKQADAQSKQAELQRRDHVAELFNRAVGQLGHEKLEIRLGAIYTLRQICDDFPDLSKPILELLATYIRENRVDYGDRLPPVDVQEVMNILRGKLGGPNE